MADVIIDKSRNKKIITRQGASFALSITVKNSDGSDYVFTGHTVTFEIFRGPTERTAELILSVGSGLTLTDGLIALSRTSAQMLALRLEKYLHLLWVTFPDGSKKLWLNGEFVINKDQYDASPLITSESITVVNTSDIIAISIIEAGASDSNIDGGSASTVYLDDQIFDGGSA